MGRNKSTKKKRKDGWRDKGEREPQVHEDDKTSKSQKKLKAKKAHDPCVMNTLI